MTIQSDLVGASRKATALKNATDKLIRSGSVSEDTQTTVAGNANAQEAITLTQATAMQIAQAVLFASSNLQSVAKDFEVMDQTVASTMFNSLRGLGK